MKSRKIYIQSFILCMCVLSRLIVSITNHNERCCGFEAHQRHSDVALDNTLYSHYQYLLSAENFSNYWKTFINSTKHAKVANTHGICYPKQVCVVSRISQILKVIFIPSPMKHTVFFSVEILATSYLHIASSMSISQ